MVRDARPQAPHHVPRGRRARLVLVTPPSRSTSRSPPCPSTSAGWRSALGVRVLERNARGVTLTPAGEVLVRHASALLDAARRAEEAVRDAAGVGRAQVRVGGVPVRRRRAAARRDARAARAPAGRRADAAGARGGGRRWTRCWPGAIDVAMIVAVGAVARQARAAGRRLPADLRRRDADRGRGRPPAGDAHVGRARGAVRRAVADHRGRRHVRGLQRRPARLPRRGLRADRALRSPTTTRRCRGWRRPGSAWR